MDIGKIISYKPDTELHGDNQFQRSDYKRATKGEEPGRKRPKMAIPVHLESVSDGVHMTEDELQNRREELLAKAEIQAEETNELDEVAARKILSLFEKRLKSNQQLRIKYAGKPDKFMKVEIDF